MDTTDDLGEALELARSADRTSVIVLRTAPDVWTEGGVVWEVGVQAESDREEVRAARVELLEAKQRQRVGW